MFPLCGARERNKRQGLYAALPVPTGVGSPGPRDGADVYSRAAHTLLGNQVSKLFESVGFPTINFEYLLTSYRT